MLFGHVRRQIVFAAEDLIGAYFAHESDLSVISIDVLLDVLQQVRHFGELAAAEGAREVTKVYVGLHMF
jgi:hypothetical protein